jgi:alpha,alpha-trehalose phosphorylase
VPGDYLRHVDGKPRYDGVRDFLRSRDIELPEGTDESPPDEVSVRGVGNRKQVLVDELLEREGVEAFPGSVAWLRQLYDQGFKLGVVSSSRNAMRVLEVAGIAEYFDTIVDGTVAAELNLPGKPAPDTFLEAARRLVITPDRIVVVEDAQAGVAAGRAGGFGLVIGVDRSDQADALRTGGADTVVTDLSECVVAANHGRRAGPKDHRLIAAAHRLLLATDEFPVDPFCLVERRYNPATLPQTETLFAVSNGYLGLRGTFEEGRPVHQTGTLLNGFYESWPIEYAESAYGFARTGQTILNVTDGTLVRLFVDDEPIDADRSEIVAFERRLDMRSGEMTRSVTFKLPDGRRVEVRSGRLTSFDHRHLAACWYEVTSLDAAASVTLVSELVTYHGSRAGAEADDPRRGRGFDKGVLEPLVSEMEDRRAFLSLRTARSGLVLGCGFDHHVVADGAVEESSRHGDDWARFVLRADLAAGQSLGVRKYLAYHHDAGVHPGDLRLRVSETLDRGTNLGLDGIRAHQREYLGRFWEDADVELDGAPLLQQAVRFSLFQLLQAAARAEGFGIPAKGLTGQGYEGHYFWDTEIYVLPFLTYVAPDLARSVLLHRYRMLPAARRRAEEVSQQGALFPWRTIGGEEASAYYAAGTAQYHIDADVAYAVNQYVRATGDVEFLAKYGAEILVETARLWLDLGFYSEARDGRFVINGVTGPDEYSTVVDNNLYTNIMAKENLQVAASVMQWLYEHDRAAHARLSGALGVTRSEVRLWRRAAERMYIPYDDERGVHLQDEHFFDREVWDFLGTPVEKYPLLLHFHPLVIYRHQVIKQADVVLATVLLGEQFTLEEKERIFDCYDPLTTGDSSLSESIQSIAAAEVGQVRAAEEYFVDAASVDLADIAGNLRDGVHVASAGGTWMAVVFGFAGLRDRGDHLSFWPMLPARLSAYRFRLRHRGRKLAVEVRRDLVRYELLEGDELVVRHQGESYVVRAGRPLEAPGPGTSDPDGDGRAPGRDRTPLHARPAVAGPR